MRFQQHEEVQYHLTIQVEGQSYLYIYDEEHEAQTKLKILRDAANPNLNLNVYYARLLIERMKDVQKERSQTDDESRGGNERDQQRY